ncbi:hypothetical protein ACFO4N_15110 [Camelliibacillus cellulosilyticus]|uniref:ABC-2 type transport system permease protein n=1 Tax=Camelliibacillus cellulosilyticus TaxID=2174486 RepID=A0ABV9GS00_9BACL
MSLTTVRPFEIIKNQYLYKLKSYSRAYTSLIIIQMLAVLFSLGGSGGYGHGRNNLEINANIYSPDIIIMFTMIWGFMVAILITTKAYRYDDFTFVTNRRASHLSNIGFLCTASLLGGVTAELSGYLFKLIVFAFVNHDVVKLETPINSLISSGVGIIGTFLYLFIACAVGYLFGMLVQIRKIFAFLLPAIFIGTIFLAGNVDQFGQFLYTFMKFFVKEPSLTLFFLKAILTAAILFFATAAISNRLEVKK